MIKIALQNTSLNMTLTTIKWELFWYYMYEYVSVLIPNRWSKQMLDFVTKGLSGMVLGKEYNCFLKIKTEHEEISYIC